MLNQVEGRFIESFIAVYEEKSFSRAAVKLGYVQSTITTHIKTLERILDTKLFHRLPRETKATDIGERFLIYAYQFKNLTQKLEGDLVELNQANGSIKVMMQESFFLTHMPSFYDFFNEKFSHMKIMTQAGFYQDILDHILNFSIDFGIVPVDPERNDIHFYPLFKEEMIFVTSPEVAIKIKQQGMSLLHKEPLLSNGNTCVYDKKAKSILIANKINYSHSIELPSLEMIKVMMLNGSGFSLLPKKSVKKELDNGKLLEIPFETKVEFTQGLICHKNIEHSYIFRLFKENILEYFHSVNQSVN